jgi:hypothetical protein
MEQSAGLKPANQGEIGYFLELSHGFESLVLLGSLVGVLMLNGPMERRRERGRPMEVASRSVSGSRYRVQVHIHNILE